MIELKIGKKYQLDSETSILLGFQKETEYKIIGISGSTATIQIGNKTVSMTPIRLIDHSINLDGITSYSPIDVIPQKMLAAQQALQKKMDQENNGVLMPKPEIIDPEVEKHVIEITPKPIEQPIVQPEVQPVPPEVAPAQPEVISPEQPDIQNQPIVQPEQPVIETTPETQPNPVQPVPDTQPNPTSPEEEEDDSNPYGRYI